MTASSAHKVCCAIPSTLLRVRNCARHRQELVSHTHAYSHTDSGREVSVSLCLSLSLSVSLSLCLAVSLSCSLSVSLLLSLYVSKSPRKYFTKVYGVEWSISLVLLDVTHTHKNTHTHTLATSSTFICAATRHDLWDMTFETWTSRDAATRHPKVMSRLQSKVRMQTSRLERHHLCITNEMWDITFASRTRCETTPLHHEHHLCHHITFRETNKAEVHYRGGPVPLPKSFFSLHKPNKTQPKPFLSFHKPRRTPS